MDVPPETVAKAQSDRGEIVVRRRADDVIELRVNGVFVMDTAETSTERLLARAALDGVADARRVLVGGFGLGFTVRELLTDSRVEQVTVAEIETVVAGWVRDGTLPGADLLDDPRVRVVVADVREVVRQSADAAFNAVLLDVDNGPGNLLHAANAALYETAFLAECRRILAPGGRLSVWSAADAPQLAERLRASFGRCEASPIEVALQGRDERYWLFTAQRH